MTLSEYDAYIATMNELEERIENDNKYPVIEGNKIKKCCKITLELSKIFYPIFYIQCLQKGRLKQSTKKSLKQLDLMKKANYRESLLPLTVLFATVNCR